MVTKSSAEGNVTIQIYFVKDSSQGGEMLSAAKEPVSRFIEPLLSKAIVAISEKIAGDHFKKVTGRKRIGREFRATKTPKADPSMSLERD